MAGTRKRKQEENANAGSGSGSSRPRRATGRAAVAAVASAAAASTSQSSAQEGETIAHAAEYPQPQEEDTTPAQARGRAGGQARRQQAGDIARNRAAHFARYNADEEEAGDDSADSDASRSDVEDGEEQWPGPFSTARQLTKGRAKAAKQRKAKLEAGASVEEEVVWIPKGSPALKIRKPVRSLLEMTAGMLCDHVEAIESLVGMPDAPRTIITRLLCEQRRLSPEVVALFTEGQPCEVLLPDCARLGESELSHAITTCLTPRLEVLSLGYCGRGMSDTTAAETFKEEGCAASLSELALYGCYRLSDVGLKDVLRGAPALTSLSLTDDPRLTVDSLHTIAQVLAPTLRSLTLDGCKNVGTPEMASPLCSLLAMDKISVANIEGVTNDVVKKIAGAWASGLVDVDLSETSVTDEAVSSLAMCCTQLKVLKVSGTSITGACLDQLASSTPNLQVLHLNQCIGITDPGPIHKFLSSPAGASLQDLGLAQVPCVDAGIAKLIGKNCSEAMTELDFSWCRGVSENAMGCMTDSLSQLQKLTLFGCSQVTPRFLDGVLSDDLKIVV